MQLTINQALALAQQHAQVAVAVEIYTLPLYLSALASLINGPKDPNYSVLQSICTEEMLHLQLAANLCVALGTQPNFTAPVYGTPPTFPNGVPILNPTDPATGDSGVLNATIGNLAENLKVFLDIETPTEFELVAFLPPYNSIGQMYNALLILCIAAGPAIPWTQTNQQTHFAPQLFPLTVASMSDIVRVVDVISVQGEGLAKRPAPQPQFFKPDQFPVSAADQTLGMHSVPADLAAISHFGRLLCIQEQGVASSTVYTGSPNPSSPANITLQAHFAYLVSQLNLLWNTGNGDIRSKMTGLLADATAVWKEGHLPQWTSPPAC